MAKSSRIDLPSRRGLIIKNRFGFIKDKLRRAPEKEIFYPLETSVCIRVFGNRILCDNQANCYCEFVRDVVNRIVDFRELN